MQKRKIGVVDRLTKGVASLMKGRKVSELQGSGRLTDKNSIVVSSADGEETITAGSIVLATGSVPAELPFLEFDGKRIVSSTEALEFDAVPKQLVVIGAAQLDWRSEVFGADLAPK